MIYISKINDEIANSLLLKLNYFKENNIGIAHNSSATQNGFQTHNLCYEPEMQNELTKILSYFPFKNNFKYRWFHMIDYEQSGFQKPHDHIKTEHYSYIIYLSSCLGGGETCFQLNHELQIKPEKNMIVFFPASILHWGKSTIDKKQVAVGALIGEFKI